MSTPFYDLASLVVVPSGYKASKIYAQKPLTTDGQLAFTRSTTATRVNSAGLIETVASNVPRLDYLNSSCPRLLLEPQRTNLVTFSEQFNNASWGKATGGTATLTVTPNSAVAPDGTTSADLITITRSTTDDISAIFRSTSTGTGTFKGSIYLKAKTLSDVGKTIDVWSWEGATRGYTKVTLTADWVRYEQNTTVFIGSGAELFDFGLLPTAYSTSTTLNVEFYAWGAQSEAGAYATSYISTLGAAVTRGADAASKTGISSLIGQTEGTIYWEGSGNATVGGADLWMAQIAVDNTNVAILIYYFASAGTVNVFINNGTTSVSLAAPMTLTQVNKVAVAYKNASFALYLNGALVDSDSSAIAPPTAMNQFAFVKWQGAANQDRALVNQALLFKTRLSNADLAALTA